MSETESTITREVAAAAERLTGLEFTDAERELMLKRLEEFVQCYAQIRAVELSNDIPPALRFDPRLPGMTFPMEQQPFRPSAVELHAEPPDFDVLPFAPVTQLAHLIRTGQLRSVELTEMYLERLRRYDPQLQCVVTLTEERALEQARHADAEIAAGNYRGPLHGIPWGAKDLLATQGIRTTWGAAPYRDQVPDVDATVVRRLEEAGAILVAKLSVGELAWGDVWFGGKTRNPWNLEEGSSGSSAGSAAATAAGLAGFAIGTETYGSIVSPSSRCGVTGLRPTFGRVSRHGAMALCWSLDKIGPICRTVEDCAVVFDAIRGPDADDLTTVDLPFNWDSNADLRGLRVGFVEASFEEERPGKANDERTLDLVRTLGAELVPLTLPSLPITALLIILEAEAATAFDELTRSNHDDLLARQEQEAWPNLFRRARTIPAVEYLQANRVRTLLMRAMQETMSQVDVFLAPTGDAMSLYLTNLSGHPAVSLPNGFTDTGSPTAITINGRLYDETTVLRVAKALQDATDYHRRRPPFPPSGEHTGPSA